MEAVEEARTCRNAAWPHAPHVLDRAKIGRQREDALSEIMTLRDRIVTARAETLADAAVQLRRLVVMAEPGMYEVVASVLAVVERGAGYGAAGNITLRNLLGI